MFRIVVISIIFVISGCASTIVEPITSSSLSETQGLLVGSISRDPRGPKYASQTFYFKNVATGEAHSIQSQPMFNMFGGQTPDDFKTSESHGALFMFSLTAGEYIFHNFELFLSNGYYESTWQSEEDYAIPFVIHPNTINYVGEIKLVPATGKNFFGMKIPAGGVWVISNEIDRDLKLMKSKHPELSGKEVMNSVPDTKVIFTPLVILPSEKEAGKRKTETGL